MTTSTETLAQTHATLLAEFLPAYLAQQRWFGAKSRTIAGVKLASSMPVEDLQAAMCVFEVKYADSTCDLYQLPLAVATEQQLEAIPPRSIIAEVSPQETLYDATANPAFRAALLRLTQGPDAPETTSRVTSAEQSNTSIIYGNTSILKLYRRLQTGENPDVEISRFLTHEAHFPNIPAYLGQLQSPDNHTLAFLQTFALNDGDGWQWMQTELAAFYKSVSSLPAPTTPTAAASFLTESTLSPEIQHQAAATLEAAALLGRRTAEMHLALAHPTDDPAFAAEPFTPTALAADATRIHAQIVSALDALKQHLAKVPADLTTSAAQLLAQRQSLFDRAHTLATASPYRFGRRIRIHGDYHLGQVLRTKPENKETPDFLIVDFEGEPARPLPERRKKQSPLRDVAGMLRSFSYSAFAALNELSSPSPNLDLWASEWERAASATFLHTYREVVAANPELIPQPEQAQALLLAFLLEKSLYELLYELNNRPTWLRIPLGGVLSLLREAA